MQEILHPCLKLDENSSARERILAIGFEEMREHGFQGLRIDRVLEKTQLTKGALYHHFKSKRELGYAIVDEILQGWTDSLWSASDEGDDPITTYQKTLRNVFAALTPADISRGCPVNNLVQEMAGLDDGFQERLHGIYSDWLRFTETALTQGQSEGSVRKNFNVESASLFIISSIQGMKGMGKCSQGSCSDLTPVVEELCNYMDTLRA